MKKEETIYESLLRSAKQYPNYVALVYRNHHYTYEEVLVKVNILANSLVENGYKKNDVITVMLPNIPMAVYLLYAINQIGAIANLIHPLMGVEQLSGIMEKTNSNILFALDSRVPKLSPLKRMGIVVYGVSPVFGLNPIVRAIYRHKCKIDKKLLSATRLLQKTRLFDYDKDYSSDRFYLHSGGTTGEAKTIALSSFALNSLCISGKEILDVTDPIGQGMMSLLPMFHGFGLCMGIHACLCYGARNVLIPKFNSNEVIKYLKKKEISILIGVPIVYEALLRNKKFKGKAVKAIDNAFVGGDFVNSSLIERFNQRMKEYGTRARLYEGYGLTETVTVCTVNTHRGNRNGSVGRAIPYTEVKAFENDKPLPAGKEGELYIRGDTLMNGYRFEKKKLDPFFVDKKKVRWIRTGDYGKVDKDGYVYFMQRLKRIVKVNGINLFPSEIENEIAKLSFVRECYLKSVEDNKHGHMLNLYIVSNDGKRDVHNCDLNTLIRSKFGVYALPKRIIYKDELPKTLIGKVDGKKLND